MLRKWWCEIVYVDRPPFLTALVGDICLTRHIGKEQYPAIHNITYRLKPFLSFSHKTASRDTSVTVEISQLLF